MQKEVPVFWGCTFTHNFPFLIKSTKTMLDRLGIGTLEIEEFGCCPDPVYLRTYGKDMCLGITARNLALAEKKGGKMMVVCNGCFNVLHGANEELQDDRTRKRIDALLSPGSAYDGKVEVVHLLDVMHSKVPVLKTMVRRPLAGLRIAVHYGCHALYPPAVRADDPKKPVSMDEIITALGAESVDYESKLDCCGIPVISFDKELGDRLLQKKLSDLKGRADCIVTACPACFMRFDMLPQEMKENAIPVFHITELACLALGVPEKDLFFEGHSTAVGPFLEKLEKNKPDEEETIKDNFNMKELSSHCEACREECTAAVASRNGEKPFDPMQAVDMLLAGHLHELVEGEEIWRCLQCGKCAENCPNNLGLKDLYSCLRKMAVDGGKAPRAAEEKLKMLEETCYAMPKRTGIRKRMGIGPAPEPDTKEVKSIIEKTRRKKR